MSNTDDSLDMMTTSSVMSETTPDTIVTWKLPPAPKPGILNNPSIASQPPLSGLDNSDSSDNSSGIKFRNSERSDPSPCSPSQPSCCTLDTHPFRNIDEFEIKAPIGYGSSAIVYSAIYTPYNKRVAIKIIDLDMFERNQIDELRRETALMALSKHPHVLRVYGSFVHGSKLYIVTPYLAGGSCLDIIRTGFTKGLEETVIATILKQALEGLAYLHRNGHIHRDVKGGNLLVAEDGTVLLADFGVSSSLMESEQRGQRKTFVGTPCWMAPEVMEQTGYDYKADIWSFGITAIELATGHAPYARLPPLKVLMLTLCENPPTLPRESTQHKYSRAFRDLIDMCLQKDPSKRPSTEKLLQHSFFKQAKKKEYLVKHLLSDLPPLELRPRKIVPRKQFAITPADEWDFNDEEHQQHKDMHSTDLDSKQSQASSESKCFSQNTTNTGFLSIGQQEAAGMAFVPKRHISFGDAVIHQSSHSGHPPPEHFCQQRSQTAESDVVQSPALDKAPVETAASPIDETCKHTYSRASEIPTPMLHIEPTTEHKLRTEVHHVISPQGHPSSPLLSAHLPYKCGSVPLSRGHSSSSHTGIPLTRDNSAHNRVSRFYTEKERDSDHTFESRKVGRFELTSSVIETLPATSHFEKSEGIDDRCDGSRSSSSSPLSSTSPSSSVSRGQSLRSPVELDAIRTLQCSLEELVRQNELQHQMLQHVLQMLNLRSEIQCKNSISDLRKIMSTAASRDVKPLHAYHSHVSSRHSVVNSISPPAIVSITDFCPSYLSSNRDPLRQRWSINCK
ncbi:kinase-like domain-containing protein [Radiomyces spectabilis]|uniref:kinase-like domain-containing protein n=1 Tax=Radiomyces spectabilis TaxID=64574 RepID=UPI0022200CF3|nr:kinase-like domain-containing protein [Radiomyces spectabilis]KAI8371558.1 kinase-like domain-containing protein [Radiomyces spectabilis]